MNITRRQLRTQFDRAKAKGWLKFFDEAARTITKGYFDTADLLAIGSRETNLDPKWLTKPGDRGNGFGLMQADRRSFPEFTKGDGWKDARTGIIFGAKVLMQKWNDYEQNIGKTLSVKGKKYTLKQAEGATAQKIAISSYNCGRWAQYCYSRGIDIDAHTTGHDYAADVMARAKVFREFLSESKVSAASPTPNTSPGNPATDEQGEIAAQNQTEPLSSGQSPEGQQVKVEGNVESINTEAPKPVVGKDETVEILKEKPSLYTRVGAGIAAITGLGINAGALIQSKIEALTPTQIAYLVIVLGLVGVAFWWYHKSAERANKLNQQSAALAADTGKYTPQFVGYRTGQWRFAPLVALKQKSGLWIKE